MSPSTTAGFNETTNPDSKDVSQQTDLDQLNFLSVLDRGYASQVMLAETKQSKQIYAVKARKKETMLENHELSNVRSEKYVFQIVTEERHPFLVNLHACFQTETRLLFIMEYVSGGHLMWHLQQGQFELQRAQLYAAEVCLALKYLHENGVVHRNLQLEHVLLTPDGHIKVTGFGTSKSHMWYGSTTKTFCGTLEFMPPEVLLDREYGRGVDWWCYGVLLYQMLLQQSPFHGKEEDEIYDAILSANPSYPIEMPRETVSILQKLLKREPEARLGSGPTDAQEVMNHAFFHGIHWEDVYYKRVETPFKPHITNATDTRNFDPSFTNLAPVLIPPQSVLSEAMQEEFRDFSSFADFAS